MRATTETGVTILLSKDGTWRSAEPGMMQSKESFRNAPWGASLSEVKVLEGCDAHQETNDYLDFEVRLGRFSCLAVYIFVGDQLVRGKYLLLEEYQNRTTHLHDYDELKTSLSKKYGVPKKDPTYWLDDLYKDDYSQWGTAVGCGHLSMFAHWETEESAIIASLYGENFDVTVSVEYVSKALETLESAVTEAKLLDDL